MKTNRIIILAAATLSFALFSGAAYAQNGAKGGGTYQLELSARAKTPAPVETTARQMVCGKCVDEAITRTDLSARGAYKPTVLVVKHLCPTCGNEWKVVGHGKAKTSVANHTCGTCGAETKPQVAPLK